MVAPRARPSTPAPVCGPIEYVTLLLPRGAQISPVIFSPRKLLRQGRPRRAGNTESLSGTGELT